MSLKESFNFDVHDIEKIEVHTFSEATRLNHARPPNTEVAQYSLPYPVAATLVDGKLDPQQVIAPRIYR